MEIRRKSLSYSFRNTLGRSGHPADDKDVRDDPGDRLEEALRLRLAGVEQCLDVRTG